MKPKQERNIPILHLALAKSFIEFCDRDGTLPYSKLKFVLRYRFRLPIESYLSIIKEFTEMNIIENIDKKNWKVSKSFLKKYSDYEYERVHTPSH